MWDLELPWYELILRAVCVFTFLFIVFRFWGKKHFGQLTAFDFLLLLIISEAVQNALVAEDNSTTAGFITIMALVSMNVLLDKISFNFRKAEKVLDGEPQVLIKEGKINYRNLKNETITRSELDEALREEGVESPSEVKLATLETDGTISVIKRT